MPRLNRALALPVAVFLITSLALVAGSCIATPTDTPSPPTDTTTGATTEPTATSEATATTEPTEVPPAAGPLEIRCVDISSLPKVENAGGVFYNDRGEQQDVLEILADHGINFVRLKLWHTPADGYNDLEDVMAMALRVEDAGMGFWLDFHYSDEWADPQKQFKPAAWEGLSYEEITAAVYEYSKDVLTALIDQGTDADIVQIGNEIRPGLIWPEGQLDGSPDQFERLSGLLLAGIDGVKDSGSDAEIMLHLDNGGDNELYVTWFDAVIAEGVEFDIIGLSFYAWWHGELPELASNMADLAERYGREMIVAETSYAYTDAGQDPGPNIAGSAKAAPGYPVSVEGQAKWMRDIMAVITLTPDGLGVGVAYWEPAWLALPGAGWDPYNPNSGNGWENQCLFDFDGQVLDSMDVFLEFVPTDEN